MPHHPYGIKGTLLWLWVAGNVERVSPPAEPLKYGFGFLTDPQHTVCVSVCARMHLTFISLIRMLPQCYLYYIS